MIFAEQRRPLEVRTLRAVTDTRFAPYTLTVIVDGPRFTALLVPRIHDHGQSFTIELRMKQEWESGGCAVLHCWMVCSRVQWMAQYKRIL